MDSKQLLLDPVQKPLAPSNERNTTIAAAAGSMIFSCLPVIGFLYLTYNSIVAVQRARGDPGAIAFVVSAYLTLQLFFWCLRVSERTPDEDVVRKQRLKVAIWLLAVTLNTMFSFRGASMMPWAVAVIIWGIAGLAAAASFYALFVHRDTTDAALTSAKGFNLGLAMI